MDDHSPQNILKGLGYGLTHLIDAKPVIVGVEGQSCQLLYLYEGPNDEGMGIFGLDYAPGTDEFGNEAWCNAAYDAVEELEAAKPEGVPLGFMICTPMQRPDPADPQTVVGFWYGIGMDLLQGMKVTIKQEPDGRSVVKPVHHEEMAGMLEQMSHVLS